MGTRRHRDPDMLRSRRQSRRVLRYWETNLRRIALLATRKCVASPYVRWIYYLVHFLFPQISSDLPVASRKSSRDHTHSPIRARTPSGHVGLSIWGALANNMPCGVLFRTMQELQELDSARSHPQASRHFAGTANAPA